MRSTLTFRVKVTHCTRSTDAGEEKEEGGSRQEMRKEEGSDWFCVWVTREDQGAGKEVRWRGRRVEDGGADPSCGTGYRTRKVEIIHLERALEHV